MPQPKFKPQAALNNLTRATPVVELPGQFSDLSASNTPKTPGPKKPWGKNCPSIETPSAKKYQPAKDARGKAFPTDQTKDKDLHRNHRFGSNDSRTTCDSGRPSLEITLDFSKVLSATKCAERNPSPSPGCSTDVSNSDVNRSGGKADWDNDSKGTSSQKETGAHGASGNADETKSESLGDSKESKDEWTGYEWAAMSKDKEVPDILQRSTSKDSSGRPLLKSIGRSFSSEDEALLGFFQACYDKSSSDALRGTDVVNFLKSAGLFADDPRLEKHIELLQKCSIVTESNASAILENSLIRKALRKDLVIKDFPELVDSIKEIYNAVEPNKGGHVATYIPQLANQNPNLWGVALCSVDGQRFSIGDSATPFCVQSTSKPITYCVAIEINGDEKVHSHVGREPSGRNFNDRCLMARKGQNAIPHNPYINAGAIMTSALVKMDASEWDRFKYMMNIWQKLAGGVKPSFQNDTFMGERATASRNFCLAYMMAEENAFPHKTDLNKTLEAYFTWCSIEITAESMAMVAATLANGGICPSTNERIFAHQTVTSCLSLMMSCGMYDFSGQFAFQIGFPAKSGVSGIMCIVIPGVLGLATFSPRLDSIGNSVRGIDFCQRLARRFPYHVFSQPERDGLGTNAPKKPARKPSKGRANGRDRRPSMVAMAGRRPSVVSLELAAAAAAAFAAMGQDRRQSETISEASVSSVRVGDFAIDEFMSTVTSSVTDEDYASMWWSATLNDVQRVRQLAVCGLNINTPNCDARSALHLAASEGHDSMVALLLELRADMHARDLHGNTPLDDAIREHKNSAKRIMQLWARSRPAAEVDKLVDSISDATADQLFLYFTGKSISRADGVQQVSRRTLIEALDGYGLNADLDSRLEFLKDFPDPLSARDLREAAIREGLIARALSGKLVVPNFGLFCEKFEDLFTRMTDMIKEQHASHHADSYQDHEEEVLNVMTTDGQRLHLGKSDQSMCVGGLMSLVVFATALELLGQEQVLEFVGAEPSGTNSDKCIVNGDNLPFNPFMWNGMLALISLLDDKCGDAMRVTETLWAKLCDGGSDEPMQCDEAWMEQDRIKHEYRVKNLLYTSLDVKTFPVGPPPEKVMDIFFQMRSIRTSALNMGSLAAVLANRGKHPLTSEQVLQPETVKYILSMMYAAGCDAQSGSFSFKVGVPAKTSREGVVLLVLPRVMGVCVVSPGVNEKNVSNGGMAFCTNFANEFNCHVLAGTATASAKADPSLYHFQSDNELLQQLSFAAETGELMTLSALHQLGFSLDNTDYDYRSAVHIAASNNQLMALKYLKQKGANMHGKDRWGFTPHDDAMRCGHHKVAAYLNSLGADESNEDWEVGSCVSGMSGMSGMDSERGKKHHKVKRVNAPCAAKSMERGQATPSRQCGSMFGIDIQIDEGDEDAELS